MVTARQLRIRDDDDEIAGLRVTRKHLSWRLLHDAHGAELAERVAALDAYYPARIELELLDRHHAVIAHHVGPEPRVIEPGGGASAATRRLLRALERPSSYVPIDTVPEQLQRTAAALRAELPRTEIQPVVADYTQHVELPVPQHEWRRTLVFFPGSAPTSAIGSFEPGEARAFLAGLGRIAGDDRLLLIAADATRDPNALLRAYDDEAGVTAAFTRNALARLNRTHGATFDLDAFEHRAVWNATASRVELQLVSTCRQLVRIDGQVIAFAPGEPIVVAHCYKHTPDAMRAILAAAGWRTRQVFTSTHQPYRWWLCEPLATLR